MIGASSPVRKPIEITWRPSFSAGMIFWPSVISWVLIPSMIGTFGPCTSPSIMPTLPPHFASAIARFTDTVVLPTPPFPAPTAMMFFTPGMPWRVLSPDTASRTRALIWISALVTPGTPITAACA